MLSADGLQNSLGACVQRRCVVRVALAAVLPVWWLSLTSWSLAMPASACSFPFYWSLDIEFFEEVTI